MAFLFENMTVAEFDANSTLSTCALRNASHADKSIWLCWQPMTSLPHPLDFATQAGEKERHQLPQ
jgi:hypothetical protein